MGSPIPLMINSFNGIPKCIAPLVNQEFRGWHKQAEEKSNHWAHTISITTSQPRFSRCFDIPPFHPCLEWSLFYPPNWHVQNLIYNLFFTHGMGWTYESFFGCCKFYLRRLGSLPGRDSWDSHGRMGISWVSSRFWVRVVLSYLYTDCSYIVYIYSSSAS